MYTLLNSFSLKTGCMRLNYKFEMSGLYFTPSISEMMNKAKIVSENAEHVT